MAAYKKFSYELKTLSDLVLSPRGQEAFYKELGDFQESDLVRERVSADLDVKKVNLIYPFYQYGEYLKYDPENADYYIPGSSIKGSIITEGHKKLLVDDIKLDRSAVKLHSLYKIQYMESQGNAPNEQNKKGKLDSFFPNIAVEMLDGETTCIGDLYCEDEDLLLQYLQDAQTNTGKRLLQFNRKLVQLRQKVAINNKTNDEMKSILSAVIDNINALSKNRSKESQASYLLLLGGYKGLLLSGLFPQNREGEEDTLNGAIYLDPERSLPHGLIEITFAF